MIKQVPHGYITVDADGRFHSENDEPAISIESYEEIEIIDNEEIVKQIDGYKAWYNHGVLHRLDGPAVIRNDGTEYFYYDGDFI